MNTHKALQVAIDTMQREINRAVVKDAVTDQLHEAISALIKLRNALETH